ncbi:unnamed protein product [Pedinophyceae sp. YPF-701]|nr:unnamed protein product [Pedinophyceae sp. YPF-701]
MREEEVALHVPGHQRGAAIHAKLKQFAGSAVFRMDLTELDGLDNLAAPSGAIATSQAAAASLMGAGRSWWLVNGATAGVHAAILATCRPGGTIIMARNCHQSAFAACSLAGVVPHYIHPTTDPALGIAHGVDPSALSAALAQHPRGSVGAVLVVSPTYFGACADVAALSDLCHAHGVPLIVDEAHGSHLSLLASCAEHARGERPPKAALQSGADLVVQSTHKTLGSLTQTALLHASQESLGAGRTDAARIAKCLRTLQTSSPSYLLMASLDAAVARCRDERDLFCEAAQCCRWARRELRRMGVHVLDAPSEEERNTNRGFVSQDPLRLTVAVDPALAGGRDGFAVAAWLERPPRSIVAEMSTPKVVVFCAGAATRQRDVQRLVAAYTELLDDDRRAQPGAGRASDSRSAPELPPGEMAEAPVIALTPRDAFFAATEAVPFAEAAGRVSAELLSPYPPGVPLVAPGEVLTEGVLFTLSTVKAGGGSVVGLADGSMETLLVVVEAEQQLRGER